LSFLGLHAHAPRSARIAYLDGYTGAALAIQKVDRLVATDYGRCRGGAIDKMFLDRRKKSQELARNVCIFALLLFDNSSVRSGYKSTNGLFGLQHFISQPLYC
jgi:hypothetical protein